MNLEPPGIPPATGPPPAPVPGAPPTTIEATSHRGVAILLGVVAVMSALVGARATSLASGATDAWQSALRMELKRSTAALEDIRYVYQVEVPAALVVIDGRVRADELRAASAAATGETAATLAMEAEVAAGIVAAIEGSVPLVAEPAYALPDGGVDIGARLADQRNETPDLVAIDPDALQDEGDHLGTKASSMTIALLPLGVAALFGATAQPFGRRRRPLLVGGTAALGIGVAIALLVEMIG